jgi:hypothetical protein
VPGDPLLCKAAPEVGPRSMPCQGPHLFILGGGLFHPAYTRL